jgi:tripartite-type tricarboxylate transporter receptor subunit TctC
MRRATLAAALLLWAAAASAQDYPNRPIRIIVPTPAGGPVDVMARVLANALPPVLGQNVFIENKPGAGNTIGSRAAASADPDGYTLMVSAASGLIMSPMIHKNAGYDASRLPISSPMPRPIPASSIIRPAASARCRISMPSCSSRSVTPISCTCRTKAAALP